MSDMTSELGHAFRRIWDTARFPTPSVVQWGALSLDGHSLAPELDSRQRQLPPLVNALRTVLYQHVYTQGGRATVDSSNFAADCEPASSAVPDSEFAASLLRANVGRERWDSGWVVEAMTLNGGLRVRKEHRVRLAAAGEYALHRGPGLAATVGESVSLHVLPQSEWLQPGYYHVLGDTLSSDDEHAEIVQIGRAHV